MANMKFQVVNFETQEVIANEDGVSVFNTRQEAQSLAANWNHSGAPNLFRVKSFYPDYLKHEAGLKLLQARFPKLRITHGYLGNCGTDSRGRFDDRQWYIFNDLNNIGLNGPDFDAAVIAMKLEDMGA